jgi:hypothetical protein
VQALQYDDRGYPVPLRPETLPGAAEPIENIHHDEKDFVPTTFVPRAKDNQQSDEGIHPIQPFNRPGLVPWRIFCMATVLLVTMWCVVGVFVALETFDVTFFKVKPLLETSLFDTQAWTPSLSTRNSTRSQLHLRPMLLEGVVIPTRWPHPGVRPRSLSCGSTGGGAGADTDRGGSPWAVVATQFGLLSARLPLELEGSKLNAAESEASMLIGQERSQAANAASLAAAQFEATPTCSEIEGESLQDVTVQCGGSNTEASVGAASTCIAIVLHRQGQRLSRCRLSGNLHSPPVASSLASLDAEIPPTFPGGVVTSAWLQDADADTSAPQEEVASFTQGGTACGKSGSCAYAETTSGRIVELQQATGSGGAAASWYPSRVLDTAVASPRASRGGGSLSIAGPGGRYLLVFHQGNNKLEVIDLHGTATTPADRSLGASAEQPPTSSSRTLGSWSLPEGQRWSSACTTGNSIYMLADGLLPQLWRFHLPAAIQEQSTISRKQPRKLQQHTAQAMSPLPASPLLAKAAARSPLLSRLGSSPRHFSPHLSMQLHPEVSEVASAAAASKI